MKKIITIMTTVLVLSVFCAGLVFAGNTDMKGHNMTQSDKIGDLIHESVVDGYMLAYYFMDLRDQKQTKKDMAAMNKSQMDKPHHIMVYIMDKNHTPVLKGRVGFLIKDSQGNTQKAMGMFMSKGFGTTADMKKQGIYKIATKALLGDQKIMDSFNYEIK